MITWDFWKFNKTTFKVRCKIVSIHYLEVLACLYFSLGFYINYVVCKSYTSQTCSRCGHVDKENRQTQETFVCTKCGFKLNADHNAAINIARGIEFV